MGTEEVHMWLGNSLEKNQRNHISGSKRKCTRMTRLLQQYPTETKWGHRDGVKLLGAARIKHSFTPLSLIPRRAPWMQSGKHTKLALESTPRSMSSKPVYQVQ